MLVQREGSAKKNINEIEALVLSAEALLVPEEASVEALFLYYWRKSTVLYHKNNDPLNALKCLLKLMDLKSDRVKLNANILVQIGFFYFGIGNFSKAITYMEKAINEYGFEHTLTWKYAVINDLATYYISMHEYNKAKKLLDEAILQLTVINNEQFTAVVMTNRGDLSAIMGDYVEAIGYFDQALSTRNRDSARIVRTLCNKAGCLRKMKKYKEAKEVLEEAKTLLSQEDEALAMEIEAECHMLSLRDVKSADFIHNTAIPFLLECGGYSLDIALALCEALEEHYVKKGSTRKALEIASVIRDIYKTMLFAGADFLEN